MGIDDTVTIPATSASAQKVLIDGVVYILRDGVWYDVLGRKIQ